MRVFLDDLREPKLNYDVICRSSEQFYQLIQSYGLDQINHISFDHDLGPESSSGYAVAKFLIELDQSGIYGQLPLDFDFNVHSANPVGRDNIIGLLRPYIGV